MANHDPAARRRVHRQGRMKGCYVYIPAQTLQEAGYPDPSLLSHYRVFATVRGGLQVRLYKTG